MTAAAEHEHDVVLLKHARYVGEFECGRRAVSRLLAQALPDDVENWVRAQQTHYTPTLAELGPVEFRRIDIKPYKPGWSVFNPTVLVHANQLVGIVRSSNYAFDGRNYIPPPEDNHVIKTKNIFVTYDHNLCINNIIPLEDPEYTRNGFTVAGLEDARLYVDDSGLAASATVRDVAPYDGRCRIGTAHIDLLSRCFQNLRTADTPSNNHEKNWMPIIGQNNWLYSCSVGGNTETVAWRDNKWARTITGAAPKLARHFRGSSQLVPFQNGYLALIHEVAFDDNRRIYSHRFVWFDSNFVLTRCSAIFFFRVKREIEFAAGLAVHNNAVIASFGVNDKQAWLAILRPEDVVARLAEAK